MDSDCVRFMASIALCMSYNHLTKRGRSNIKADDRNLPYKAVQVNESNKDGHVMFRSERIDVDTALQRARDFYALQNQRRSLRFFSSDDVPLELLLQCVATAGTAPSGAHQQPWHFCIIKSDAIKQSIRDIVEKEEQVNYDKRMKKSWVKDVEPLVSNTELYQQGVVKKPYLSEAPYLVVVTEVTHGLDPNTGEKKTHYYTKEGVGLAVGLFLSALTNVGLFTLTSTPLNAGSTILDLLHRPANEKLFLLMPVGYPGEKATVPFRSEDGVPLRKQLTEIHSVYS